MDVSRIYEIISQAVRTLFEKPSATMSACSWWNMDPDQNMLRKCPNESSSHMKIAILMIITCDVEHLEQTMKKSCLLTDTYLQIYKPEKPHYLGPSFVSL